jgi:hypothetical protein
MGCRERVLSSSLSTIFVNFKALSNDIPQGVTRDNGVMLYDPRMNIATRKSKSLSIQGHREKFLNGSMATQVELCGSAKSRVHPILEPLRSGMPTTLLVNNFYPGMETTCKSRGERSTPLGGTRGNPRSHFSSVLLGLCVHVYLYQLPICISSPLKAYSITIELL